MTDRERIHQLVDKALDVHERTGRHAEIGISSHGGGIRVWVMEGGFAPVKGRGSYRCLDMRDRDRLQEVMGYLDGLLEKDPSGSNRRGVQDEKTNTPLL